MQYLKTWRSQTPFVFLCLKSSEGYKGYYITSCTAAVADDNGPWVTEEATFLFVLNDPKNSCPLFVKKQNVY